MGAQSIKRNDILALAWIVFTKQDGWCSFHYSNAHQTGGTYLYKFPIVQQGTHWYHSHSGLQEQIGMYGAFIMNKRKEWDIPTIIPLVISEWTDMKPEEVHRSLHAATDWFAVQKEAPKLFGGDQKRPF
jgi:FtsP/CotA-like multicopper oxidase with cupredoxin domain